SDYRELDFEYVIPLTGSLASFDTPVEKNYSNTQTYRFGLSYLYSSELTLMFGFGIDESPVPESTLNFELPDADAFIYSTGFKYHASKKVTFALAYLISQKKDRPISNTHISGIFESSAHLLNTSLIYIF
ncbi:MAG: aromatic hydrocarbon degradation protein, partial [Planctomycetota bacterium]